jgi:hypothetical protein
MIIVEPTPRSDTTIVVVHHPLQSLHVAIHKVAHLLWVVVVNTQLALCTKSETPLTIWDSWTDHIIRALPLIHLFL